MKIPNWFPVIPKAEVSLARIVSEDSQRGAELAQERSKSSKDS